MIKGTKTKTETKVIEHHFEGTESFQELLAFTIKQEVTKKLSRAMVKKQKMQYNVNQVDTVIAVNKAVS